MRRHFILFRALACVALSLLPACGGCDDDNGGGGAQPDAGGADPCAAPPIDQTGIARFADGVRFLYDGACPRQTGVDPKAIDPLRVGVIRGRVLDKDGAPLSGVVVSAPKSGELGQTTTARDGTFDFVANGASRVTLRFAMAGRLAAQRTALLKPNRFLVLDDVALLAPSAKTTHVSFGSGWQTATGESTNDQSGGRAALVLFAPNTSATLKRADGSATPFTEGTLRITEHTQGALGPQLMPASLPSSSAYTYATSFAFDEADPLAQIVFDKPAISYVDNFLHMKVGVAVPSGAYEPVSDTWSSEDSGRVVGVLSAAGGIALDVDGDGQADSSDALAALGITNDELTAASASLKPGISYLRVPLAHFSSWDMNWGFGPPLDALFGPDGSGDNEPSLPCLGSGGSTYECETRTLGEDLPLVGTGASLHYQSDRVPGRTAGSTVEIAVTGPKVPASAKSAVVSVSVLGVLVQKTFAPLTPNMSYTFTWDGKDAYGRLFPGGAIAEVSVGLVYDGVYQDTQTFGAWAGDANGNGSGTSFDITGDKTRKELTLATAYEVRLGVYPHGYLQNVQDTHGNVVAITRDASGRATEISAPFGQKSTLAYDANGYLAKLTDPIGREESLSYGNGGLLTKRVDVGGGVHSMSYDATGLLVTDATPENATFSFSSSGTPTSPKTQVMTGLGRKEAHAWSAGPDVDETRTVTARDGTSTTWTMGRDNTVHAVFPTGAVLDATLEADPRLGMLAPYNAHHQITLPSGLTKATEQTLSAKTDAAGKVLLLTNVTQTADGMSTSQYDGPSRTWTFTSSGGRKSQAVVDGEGRLSELRYPGMLPIAYGYDARGRLATVTRGDRVGTYVYDASGALQSYTDPLGRLTKVSRDGALRPLTATAPDGAVTTYGWNDIDALTALTPPGKGKHALAYGKDGLISSYTAPSASPQSFNYDQDRELGSWLHEDGAKSSITRDSAGRAATFSFAGGSVGFTYDSKSGLLSSASGPSGTGLSFAYDGVLRTEIAATGGTHGKVSFSVDPMFRLKEERVNDGDAVAFDYDSDGLITGAGDIIITRDPTTGQLTKTNLGLVESTWANTNHGELAALSVTANGTALLTSAFTFDKRSRVVSKMENGVSWGYSYDPAGRLGAVTKDGAAFANYAYDSNGNLTSGLGGTASFDAEDKLVSKAGATYTYTPRGERSSVSNGAGTTSYSYDGRGNLSHVSLPGGISVDYELDAFGRRVARRRNGSVTNRFLYRSALQPAAEVDDAGTLTTRYVYALGGSAPDEMIRGGKTYALVKDDLGSVRFVVEQTTDVPVQSLTYDVWGNVTSDTNPGFQPFGFAGGMYDADTGLVRFGAREYDPSTARFLTKDPSGFGGGTNVYAYADGDPVNFVDREGHFAAIAVAAAEGAFLAYVDEAASQALDPNQTGYDCAAIASATAMGAATGALAGAAGSAFGRGGGGGAYGEGGGGGCSGGLCEAGNCFEAGTSVHSARGEVTIESLCVGDWVWAEDAETHEIALHQVVRTFARNADDVVTMEVAEETADASRVESFHVTAGHRWWTEDRGWIEASKLEDDEPLATIDGGRAWVLHVFTAEPTTARVFNVEVEGAHTYFVGNGAVWVHNACGPGSGPNFQGPERARRSGATPNSVWTKTSGDRTTAIQNTIYDANGDAVAHVDFKDHGAGAPPGHGHTFPPGQPGLGHGDGATHIAPSDVPSDWSRIPAGVRRP